MSLVVESLTPKKLEHLLRLTRRSASLDYVKWWAAKDDPLPTMIGVEQIARVVTMQDVTPKRLRSLS